jgi:hypothetical protein
MWLSEVFIARERTASGKGLVSQGYCSNQGCFGGSESSVLIRQPGEYLRVTCECGGEGLSDPGEETAVEVNHT